jgi:prepilin-type N-terminal cleavage/methylation domain-containing protein
MNLIRISKRGFSLVEMLLALAIAAVVLVGLVSTFRAGLAIYGRLDRDSSDMHETRLFAQMVESELRNMVYYSEAPFRGERGRFTFPAVVQEYDEETSHESAVLITYEYREKSLYRKTVPLRDVFGEKHERSKKIVPELKSFVVQYAYRTEENPEILWQESWQESEGLPRGIRIRMAFEPRSVARGPREELAVDLKIFIPHGNWGWIKEALS